MAMKYEIRNVRYEMWGMGRAAVCSGGNPQVSHLPASLCWVSAFQREMLNQDLRVPGSWFTMPLQIPSLQNISFQQPAVRLGSAGDTPGQVGTTQTPV